MGANRLLFIGFAMTSVLGCDAILPTEPDPDNCVNNPAICEDIGICNPITKTCGYIGGCVSVLDCPSNKYVVCKVPRLAPFHVGNCVPCQADSHCVSWSTEFSPAPRRNFCEILADGPACVECRTDADCTVPQKDSTDHVPDPLRPICDSVSHQCRG